MRLISKIVIGILWDLILMALLPILLAIALFTPTIRNYVKTRCWIFSPKNRISSKSTSLFYCSSAGEFEQALPLAFELRKRNIESVFVFFSINGFKHAVLQKHDFKSFMAPFDSFLIWSLFLNRLKPSFSIIVKHEFWPCFISSAALFGDVKAILVPQKDRTILKGIIQKILLNSCDQAYFISSDLKKEIGNFRYSFCQDTRPNGVLLKLENGKETLLDFQNWKKSICGNQQKLLVIGNAYLADVQNLIQLLPVGFGSFFKIVIIPHAEKEVKKITQFLDLNYENKHNSFFKKELAGQHDMLIGNVYGQLLWFYSIADANWIGGGFCVGVHSIWEPAAFDIPLACGPNLNMEPDALLFDQKMLLNRPSVMIQYLISEESEIKTGKAFFLQQTSAINELTNQIIS